MPTSYGWLEAGKDEDALDQGDLMILGAFFERIVSGKRSLERIFLVEVLYCVIHAVYYCVSTTMLHEKL